MDAKKLNNHKVDLGIFRLIVILPLVFFMIYRIVIPGLPAQLTSTRISILILGIIAIFQNYKGLKFRRTYVDVQFLNLIKVLFVFFIISTILGIVNGWGPYAIAKDYFEFIVVWFVAFFALRSLIKDEVEFSWLLLIISFVQSSIIFFCTFNSEFRHYINTTFNSLSYWNTVRDAEEMFSYGYAYGLGCMTSTGSIQLLLGQFAVVFLLAQKKNSKIVLWISFLVITAASTMVSRIGLLFGLITLLFLIPEMISTKRAIKLLVGVGFIILIVYWFIFKSPFSEAILKRFSRLFYLFEHGIYDSYFDVYTSGATFLPPLLDNFFFGTGITSGTTNYGVIVQTDSGYLKTYAAIGFIPTIIFYVYVIHSMFRTIFAKSKDYLFIRLLLIGVVLIAEMKEMVFCGYFVCVFFVFASLLEKSRLLAG